MIMRTTAKQLRRIVLLFCFIAVGTQSLWAQLDTYTYRGRHRVNDMVFILFSVYNSYFSSTTYKALLVEINSENEDVVVPSKVFNDYNVIGVGADIVNDHIRSLTFENSPKFHHSFNKWEQDGTTTSKEFNGSISSKSLQRIESGAFLIRENEDETPELLCPNLSVLVINSSVQPSIDSPWSNISTTPAENITAVVKSWTQEECDQNHEESPFWSEFKAVVPTEDGVFFPPLDLNPNIKFKDRATKIACVGRWDTNGDHELSYEEAAAVTNIYGTSPFANNPYITSFDELQYFTSLKSLSTAFFGCTSLKSVVIPASVTNVSSAFQGCTSLERVIFASDSTLTSIGDRAFQGCASLGPSLNLPQSITTIGVSAFEGCSKLGTTLSLPDGVTQISTSAFKDCTSLLFIHIPKSVSTLSDPIFTGCTNLAYMAVDPENTIYDSRDNSNAIIERNVGYDLRSVLRFACKNSTIPEGVHSIGSTSFTGLPITQIVLPSTTKLVGHGAFAACQYLESVECKAKTPPTYQGNPFSDVSQNCVLTVPYGCTEAYEAAGWKTQDDGGVFKEIVEAERSVADPSPILRLTMVNGAGGKSWLCNTTSSGQTVVRAFDGAREATFSLIKANLGDEFKLKTLRYPGRYNGLVYVNGELKTSENSGDTLIYDLGNLRHYTDTVVVACIYGESFDMTKRVIRTKSKGTGENFGLCALFDTTHREYIFTCEPTDFPLDRVDTLDINTEYQIQFLGAKDFNLKRITINDEEVTAEGNANKRTPVFKLTSFDANILIEFDSPEEEITEYTNNLTTSAGGLTALVATIDGVQQTFQNSDPSSISIASDLSQPVTVLMRCNTGYELQFFFNGITIEPAPEGTPNDELPGNYLKYNGNNTYEFTVNAEQIIGGKNEFVAIYKKKNEFDMNGDGSVTIADVTQLVNKILGRE